MRKPSETRFPLVKVLIVFLITLIVSVAVNYLVKSLYSQLAVMFTQSLRPMLVIAWTTSILDLLIFFSLFYFADRGWLEIIFIGLIMKSATFAGSVTLVQTQPMVNPNNFILSFLTAYGDLFGTLIPFVIFLCIITLIIKLIYKKPEISFWPAVIFAFSLFIPRLITLYLGYEPLYDSLRDLYRATEGAIKPNLIINSIAGLITYLGAVVIVFLLNIRVGKSGKPAKKLDSEPASKPKKKAEKTTGFSKSDIKKYADELVEIGKKCCQDHALLSAAMAERLKNTGTIKAEREDVANDIVLMTTDVVKYSPAMAAELKAFAVKLKTQPQPKEEIEEVSEPESEDAVVKEPAVETLSESADESQEIIHIGTRYRDEDHARTNWVANHLRTYTPVVIVRFPSLDAAREAILELSYIHEEAESGELITNRLIEFGCYQNSEGQGEVIICGGSLTSELWLEAKEKLTEAGGTLYKEQEPEEKTNAEKKADAGSVKFLRKEQNGNNTYEIYRGGSEAAATAFLQQHPVTERLYYVVVETPDGNFGRDIDGIYKE